MLYKNKEWTRPVVACTMPPLGLKEAMEGLTREVLRNQPKNLHSFCSNYFWKLLELRDEESGRRTEIHGGLKKDEDIIKVCSRNEMENNISSSNTMTNPHVGASEVNNFNEIRSYEKSETSKIRKINKQETPKSCLQGENIQKGSVEAGCDKYNSRIEKQISKTLNYENEQEKMGTSGVLKNSTVLLGEETILNGITDTNIIAPMEVQKEYCIEGKEAIVKQSANDSTSDLNICKEEKNDEVLVQSDDVEPCESANQENKISADDSFSEQNGGASHLINEKKKKVAIPQDCRTEELTYKNIIDEKKTENEKLENSTNETNGDIDVVTLELVLKRGIQSELTVEEGNVVDLVSDTQSKKIYRRDDSEHDLDTKNNILERVISCESAESTDLTLEKTQFTNIIQDSNYKTDDVYQQQQMSEDEHKIMVNEEMVENVTFQNRSMDMENAAPTIQAVFRAFLFRSQSSNHDDSRSGENATNELSNVCAEHINNSENEEQLEPINMQEDEKCEMEYSDKSPATISKINTILHTVKEEKSASSSADDSSTLSIAATKIQAQVRRFLTMKKVEAKKAHSLDTTALSIEDYTESLHDNILADKLEKRSVTITCTIDGRVCSPLDDSIENHNLQYYCESTDRALESRRRLKREDAIQSLSPFSSGDESTDEIKGIEKATVEDNASYDNSAVNIYGNGNNNNSNMDDVGEIEKTKIKDTENSTGSIDTPDNKSANDMLSTQLCDESSDDFVKSEEVDGKNLGEAALEENPSTEEKSDKKPLTDNIKNNTSNIEMIPGITTDFPHINMTALVVDEVITNDEKPYSTELLELQNELSKSEKEQAVDGSNMECSGKVNGSPQEDKLLEIDQKRKINNETNTDKGKNLDIMSTEKKKDCEPEQAPENKSEVHSISITESVDYQKLEVSSDVSMTNYTSVDFVQYSFSQDEMDVVTCNVQNLNRSQSDVGVDLTATPRSHTGLLHSGEFHDIILPTKVVRRDMSPVRGE